jgi:hypothetical protein
MKAEGSIDADELQAILESASTGEWTFFDPVAGERGGTIFRSADGQFVIALNENGVPFEGRMASYVRNGFAGLESMWK